MTSTNTFGVHYVLRHPNRETKLWTIYARIVVNGGRTEMALKCKILHADWNAKKGAAKDKKEELQLLNLYLDEVRAKLLSHFRSMELHNELLTAELLKERYLGTGPKAEPAMTLVKAIGEHNKLAGTGDLEEGTLKNYRTTLRYVKNYCAENYAAKDVYLKHLAFKFIVELASYIVAHPIKKNRPCTRNGLMKHMERIKKISNWCVTMGYLEKNPFEAFELKFTRKDPVFLTIEELQLMEQFSCEDLKMQLVADLFVFSCYTGLDYGDLMDLHRDNIGMDKNGNTWIYTNRNKTDIRVVVPLLAPALAIYHKYQQLQLAVPMDTITLLPAVKGQVNFDRPGHLFPWISNQELNRCLKIIALAHGITKALRFKTARHTFATTVTLLNGVPIETISKMLGHTKLSTTMIYTHITHAKIGADMQQLQQKLTAAKTTPLSLPKAS